MAIGSVTQALRIIRRFVDRPEPAGVNALARELGLSPSSCFNLLKTLVSEEFLIFDEERKSYALGPALSRLARRVGSTEIAIAAARPAMAMLAATYSMAAGLWKLSGDRLVLVFFADSELAIRIHMTVGQRLPRLIGAIGRCVAAYSSLDERELKEEFSRLRWQRAPGFERYKREVRKVRETGWAVDDGDFMRGLTTYAAPVLDSEGNIRYCIASTVFQGQLPMSKAREIGDATAEVARELSARLDH